MEIPLPPVPPPPTPVQMEQTFIYAVTNKTHLCDGKPSKDENTLIPLLSQGWRIVQVWPMALNNNAAAYILLERQKPASP